MVIHDPQPDQKWMWPLGQDIIEECKTVDSLREVHMEHWDPLFDPYDFNNKHGPLSLEKYRLTKEELFSWAE